MKDITFLIDSSKSMEAVAKAVIEGYNDTLHRLAESGQEILISMVDFNFCTNARAIAVPLADAKTIAPTSFQVKNSSAILDSIGTTIYMIKARHRDRTEKPDETVVVVFTDGQDTLSSTFSVKSIETIVNNARDNEQWRFLYIGANKDAQAVASKLGIHRDLALTWKREPEAVRKAWASVAGVLIDDGFFNAGDREGLDGG